MMNIIFDIDCWKDATKSEQEVAALSVQPDGWQLESLETYNLSDTTQTIAHFIAPEGRFALIPGGRFQLGLPQARVDFTPQRFVDLRPFFIEVDPQVMADSWNDARKISEDSDFVLPSIDQWEVACRGGATTVYRWGERHPVLRPPSGYGAPTSFDDHLKPNAYGLIMPHDSCQWEFCTHPNYMLGGDGGISLSGPSPNYLAWRTLASSFRWISPTLSDPKVEWRGGAVRRVREISDNPLTFASHFPPAGWARWSKESGLWTLCGFAIDLETDIHTRSTSINDFALWDLFTEDLSKIARHHGEELRGDFFQVLSKEFVHSSLQKAFIELGAPIPFPSPLDTEGATSVWLAADHVAAFADRLEILANETLMESSWKQDIDVETAILELQGWVSVCVFKKSGLLLIAESGPF